MLIYHTELNFIKTTESHFTNWLDLVALI